MPENIDKTLALRNAIKSGETELAKNLIFSLDKADLDEQDKDGKTPLHLATSYGDIVIVNALIDRKVNLELKDRIGRTPLHYAAQSDRLEVAEILITKGAYIDSTDEYNITPLSIALYHASPEFFKFLKDNRAKVDVKGKDGLTILTLAKIRVKNLLLDAYAENEKELKDADTKLAILTGVDPASYSGVGFKSNISDNSTDEKKLLEEAIDKNDVKLAINLIKSLSRKDLESKIDSDGNTFIHLASFKGHTKIIESLLDKGIDVNIRNNNNDTPLHFGSYSGRIENINFLLEREANLNLENNQCNTALHLAVHFLTTSEKIQDQAKYNAIIKLLTTQKVALKKSKDQASSSISDNSTDEKKLLEEAIDKNDVKLAINLIKSLSRKDLESKIDSDGNTFIHLASFKGHTKIIESLLDKGIDVNIRNNNNDTPLHFGSYSGRIENINFLLEREANLNLENNQCNTALHLAVHFLTTSEKIQDQAKYNAIIKLLTTQKVALKKSKDQASSSTPEVFFLYNKIIDAINNNLESVKDQIKSLSNEDVNYQDQKGNSLLHFAVAKDRSKIVKFLLQNNANVNQANKEGDTPLHLASFKGNVEIVRELLGYGAKLDTLNDNKKNAIHLATESKENFNQGNHGEVIRILKTKERQLLVLAKRAKNSVDSETDFEAIRKTKPRKPKTLLKSNSNGDHEDVKKSKMKSGGKRLKAWRGRKSWSRLRLGSNKSYTSSAFFKAQTFLTRTRNRIEKVMKGVGNIGVFTRSKALFEAKNLLTNTRIAKTERAVINPGVLTRSKAPKSNTTYEIIPITLLSDNQIWEVDYFETTKLLSGVFHGDHDLVKKLLSTHKVNVNECEERFGISPLHLAVQKDDKDIIEILLKARANPNLEDKFLKTPLDYVIARSNPNLEDKFLKTRQDYAIEGNHEDVMKLMTDANAGVGEFNDNTQYWSLNIELNKPVNLSASSSKTQGGVNEYHYVSTKKRKIDEAKKPGSMNSVNPHTSPLRREQGVEKRA